MIYQFRQVIIKLPFGQTDIEWFLNGIYNIENQMREIFEIDKKPKKSNKSEKLFVKVTIC